MGHFIILDDKEQSRMTMGSIITVNMEILHNLLMVISGVDPGGPRGQCPPFKNILYISYCGYS